METNKYPPNRVSFMFCMFISSNRLLNPNTSIPSAMAITLLQNLGNLLSIVINPTEFAVLELLYHKGDQPIQQIGKKVLLASSSITYVVDKLEKKKLLERKSCPKDRRVTYATITGEGKVWMSEIFPKHREGIQKIFGGLNEDEKQMLIKQLKKLGFYAQDL